MCDIMNIWIVYDSKFGNNKRIADALGECFKSDNNVQISHAKKISPKKVAQTGVDIFLFGGPLHAGQISFTMKRWATTLANLLVKQHKTLKKVAVWGSHATNDTNTPPQFSWNATKLKWKAVLEKFQAEKKLDEVIGFDINPKTLQGPLEPGWEKNVSDFAEKIKQL
jgi:flavodoxin